MRLNGRFFFSEYDPAPLGAFRIALGVFLVVFYLALGPEWARYYGPGGLRPEPVGQLGWSVFAWSWVPIRVWWAVGLVSSAILALGWRSRVFAAILFVLQSSMNHASPLMVNGEDLILRVLLFYGMFAPLGAAFSPFATGSGKGVERSGLWALRLMQINVAAVYAFSLPLKLSSDPSWLNGQALYWIMMSSLWRRWPVERIFYHGGISRWLTFSTVFVEGSFPVLVWFRRTRIPVLCAITLFHLGLAIFLQNVTFFSFAMICSFLLFVPAPLLRRLEARLVRKTEPSSNGVRLTEQGPGSFAARNLQGPVVSE